MIAGGQLFPPTCNAKPQDFPDFFIRGTSYLVSPESTSSCSSFTADAP